MIGHGLLGMSRGFTPTQIAGDLGVTMQCNAETP